MLRAFISQIGELVFFFWCTNLVSENCQALLMKRMAGLAAKLNEQVFSWIKRHEANHRKHTLDASQRGDPADLAQPLKVSKLVHANDELELSSDFAEFKRGVETPTLLEQWTASLPLPQLLASALPISEGKDPLEAVSTLDDLAIEAIGEAFKEGLKAVLPKFIRKLKVAHAVKAKAAEAAKEGNAAEKFQVHPMSCGKIRDFHEGLESRVGSPHSDFYLAAEAEHCTMTGANVKFVTQNYRVETTPAFEWNLIVSRAGKSPSDWEVERRQSFASVNLENDRRIPDVNELLELETVRKANLQRVEVIIVVEYTGPMYQVYNTILRRYPAEVYAMFEKGRNLYSTTIHVLVSAVQKLCGVMKLPRGIVLYRGLGGVDLPEWFRKPDEHGCQGITEWGFMSTTADKSIAIKYSGAEQGRPRAMVLAVEVGSVDRGACIHELSQYQKEKEYLWVPCSFLEPAGTERVEVSGSSGMVEVIPVRVNANLKTSRIEDIVERKKTMHLAAFKFDLDQLSHALLALASDIGLADRLAGDKERVWRGVTYTVEGLMDAVMVECRRVLERHGAVPAEEYVKGPVFRALVTEMLEVRLMAESKLRYYVEAKSEGIRWLQEYPLRQCIRLRTALLKKQLAAGGKGRKGLALELCKVRGLLQESVKEENEMLEPRLVCAAADGANPRDLHLLLAAGARLDSVEAGGKTGLLVSAQYGHAEVVSFLIKAGSDINWQDTIGRSALHLAASYGHMECVEALLEAGAQVEIITGDVFTPLIISASCGETECVERLLRARADVNHVCYMGTALHLAAQNGETECVDRLLGARADVNHVCDQGTALHLAAQSGETECVERLLRARADVNYVCAKGFTALYLAVQNGHAGCVKALEAQALPT